MAPKESPSHHMILAIAYPPPSHEQRSTEKFVPILGMIAVVVKPAYNPTFGDLNGLYNSEQA